MAAPDAANAPGSAPRRLVLVLGMHRSGTSLLAEAVHHLGATLPATPMAPGPDNPDGFFESAPLVGVNDAILGRAGSSWADWRRLDTGGLDRADPALVATMRETLAAEFGGTPLAVWKDPRLAALLPCWRALLDDAGCEPVALIALRQPGAVARSLEQRNGFPPGLSVLLWLRHLLDAERHTRDLRRAVVVFDDLLADWREALDRAGAGLGLAWPVPPASVTRSFVRARASDDRRPPEIASAYGAVWCRHAMDAFGAIAAGAADRPGQGPRAILDRLRDQFDDATRLFGGERRLAPPEALAVGPASRQPAPAGRPVLAGVTLVAADTRAPALAARAMARSLAVAGFGDALLFTDRDFAAAGPIRVVRIASLPDLDAYGRFLHRDLAGHVATSHVLVVQWDGWAVDASAWDPRFLDYDYVGARWAGRGAERSVGNGGFSLRSRRLLLALRDDGRFALEPGTAEDALIGGAFRPALERDHGIRFAPEAVADRFSTERILPTAPAFGFHGAFNLWRHCDDEAILAIASDLPDEVRDGRAVVELAAVLLRVGRIRPARALAGRAPSAAFRAALRAMPGGDEAAALLDSSGPVGHDRASPDGKS